MIEWFYNVDDAIQGPINTDELRNQIQAKKVSKRTLVWNENMTDWLAASEVAELSKLFATQTISIKNTYEPNKFHTLLFTFRNNPGFFTARVAGVLIFIISACLIFSVVYNHQPQETERLTEANIPSTTSTTEISASGNMGTTDIPSEEPSTHEEENESTPTILVVYYPTQTDFKLDDIKFHIRLVSHQDISTEKQVVTILLDVTNNSQEPFTLQQRQLFLADDKKSFYDFSHNTYWYEKSINPGLTKSISTQFEVATHRRYFLVLSGFKTKPIIALENIPSLPNLKPEELSTKPIDNNPAPKKLAPLKPLIPQRAEGTFPTNPQSLPSMPEYEPVQTQQPDWSAYMQRVSQRMSRWQPPNITMNTSVVVSMTINREGRLVNATIKVPSPSLEINQAALAIANSPEPFPPLPPEYQGQTQTIDYRFDYTGFAPSYYRRR